MHAEHLIEAGDYVAAEAELRKAVRITEETLGEEHPSLVFLLHDLGLVCHVRDKYADAETVLKRAVHLGRKLFGRYHRDVVAIELSLVDVRMERAAEAHWDLSLESDDCRGFQGMHVVTLEGIKDVCR